MNLEFEILAALGNGAPLALGEVVRVDFVFVRRHALEDRFLAQGREAVAKGAVAEFDAFGDALARGGVEADDAIEWILGPALSI